MPSSQSPSQEVSPFNANPSNWEIKVGDQSLKVVSIEQTISIWSEQKLKINDLQNFLFNTLKWLLLNYPEYGKDFEEIEPILIDVLRKSSEYLDSK